MSRPVADDVIAVLERISDRFQSSGSQPDVEELRTEAVKSVARIEFEAKRFKNYVSAENSIHDACVRRLGYKEVAEFDGDVDAWRRGRPDALNAAVLAKITTIAQRQRLAAALGISDTQPTTPQEEESEFTTPEYEEWVLTQYWRRRRDNKLSKRVKAMHNYECQICRSTISLPDGSRYAEGHHIKPLGPEHGGPDEIENIICLCPNHHAQCDLGAIELVRYELRSAVGHAVAQQYIDYHNTSIYKTA